MASSFFIRPSLFSMLTSWLEILDLSHSRSSAAILDSGVLWRVSRVRGGINGTGKATFVRAEDQRELGAGEVFAKRNRCAAQAKE